MGCILFHPARELLADEIFIPDSGGVGRALYLVQRGSRKRERRGDLQPGRGDRRPFQNGSYLATLRRWISQQSVALRRIAIGSHLHDDAALVPRSGSGKTVD